MTTLCTPVDEPVAPMTSVARHFPRHDVDGDGIARHRLACDVPVLRAAACAIWLAYS